MRVPYVQPGRRAREERVVAGQLPDYDTDDRGEPSDAGAEEVRTYVSHRFVVAAVSILQRCGWRSQHGAPVRLIAGALEQVSQRWRRQRLLISTVRNR